MKAITQKRGPPKKKFEHETERKHKDQCNFFSALFSPKIIKVATETRKEGEKMCVH